MARDFFPPREIPYEDNLQRIFDEGVSMSETELCSQLLDVIPNLNHDQVIDLALYLSFEAKLNDQSVWRQLESAAYESLHLYSLKQIC